MDNQIFLQPFFGTCTHNWLNDGERLIVILEYVYQKKKYHIQSKFYEGDKISII